MSYSFDYFNALKKNKKKKEESKTTKASNTYSDDYYAALESRGMFSPDFAPVAQKNADGTEKPTFTTLKKKSEERPNLQQYMWNAAMSGDLSKYEAKINPADAWRSEQEKLLGFGNRKKSSFESKLNKKVNSAIDNVFQAGAFEDGYDFGDVTKTILGTAGDVGLEAAKGFASIGEGLGDLASYGVAGVADLFGADDYADDVRDRASDNLVDEWTSDASDFLNQYSISGNTTDAIAGGIGQIAPIILTGGAASMAGLGSAGTTVATTGMIGLSSMGSGMSEAYLAGADDEEALKYGFSKGLIDAGTELMFGGLGKASKAIGIGKSAIPLDDVIAKAATSKITDRVAKNLVQYGIKSTAEGVEEVVAGYLTAHAKKGTYMADKDFSEILEDENLLEQFIVSTVTSAVAQSGYVPAMKNGSVRESIKADRDFITGLTDNEQAVIKKEVENRIAEAEKNGKKLTNKEKSAIEDKVEKDLEKGYISIDTIEEVLGGSTFEEYKSITEREKTLTDEITQLENLPKEQITVKQSERLSEAREELKNLANKDEIKSKLSDEVFGLVKNSYLAESYNERARKGQAFEADLSQYKGKQKIAVERAIKSGVLNNTNRSHELVNILSKIEADKGIVFDYTDNAKLKESGFAVEGKTVNGFVKNGAVTLNVQSSKAWQSTVGHEVTHVLEGTEAYGALQKALFDYAESKGELASRKAKLTELYNGIDADVDAELTADLVGDYLFNDSNFINKLTGNVPLFKKLWDEVKYLCKVATGKELAEIEKVEHEFSKAWKELGEKGVKTDGKTKLSMSGENSKTADTSLLAKAEQMLESGTDSETVRKETGWYKGYDGKMRYEIDDSGFEFYPEGLSKNPDVLRTRELQNKWRKGEATETEFSELQSLLKKVDYGELHPTTLSKMVAHKELFEAYPQLKDMKVVFLPLSEADGYYSLTDKKIVLNEKLEGNEALRETLIHEIQHAIQHIEGFANGASVEYWQEQRQDIADTIQGAKENLDLFLNDIGIKDFTKKSIQEVRNNEKTLDQHWEDLKEFKANSKYAKEIAVCEAELAEFQKQYDEITKGMTAYEQYRNTAGEIEAWDTGNRLNLTAEERKNTRPDIDRENVVFADNVKYSVSEESKVDSVYSKAVESGNTEVAQKILDDAAKKAGYDIKAYHGTGYDFTVFDKSRQGDNYEDWGRLGKGFYFAPTSREAETWAELSKGGKNKVMPVYLRSENMLDSFEALPDNLKDTIPENWDSLTRRLAEKYAYNYIEYMQEFGYNVQEILTEKGYDGINGHTEFVVFDPEQVKSADLATYDDKGNEIPLSQRFNKANDDIRYSLSAETDAEYMSAVQRGDLETAQRMVEETANGLGYNIRAYHGTARGDRVGNVFLPERATSGPMAFFTDDKQIAENYSKSKPDTSMAYDPDYDRYETQFRIKRGETDLALYEAWRYLPYDAKQRITQKASQLREDWDGDNDLILDPETNEANGGFQWQLKEARGNALLALNEQWLNSGTLYGEESRFLEVLEMAGVNEEFKNIGMDNLYFKDPDAKHEKVYDTFLKITKPFDTSTVNEEFVAELESWYDEQDQSKYETETSNADAWDKNNISAYDFAQRLRSDIENNTTHAWTSIPDAVTDFLKSKGYDGIKDTGGKYSGESHIVYIPFSSEQIKSAEPITYDDKGGIISLSERFNPDNVDIRYSLSKQGEQFSPTGNYSTPINETALAPMQEDIAPTANETQLADDIAPITEEEANALQDELFNSITDMDAPPEVETAYDNMPDTTPIDDKALRNIGKSLRETLSLTPQETKAIQEIVQEYSTTETPNRDKLFDTIKEKFGEKVWKEKNQDLADVKRFLRTNKINVSPQIKADIADYKDFRKGLGNKLGTSKDGLSVDVAYRQLVEMYPEYFSEDIWNETDQFLRMAEVASMDLYTQESYPLDDEVIQEAVNIVLNEVRGYKENLTRTAAEETAREALDSIAPLKAEQLANGSRGDALLNQSLDNFPIKTVEDRVAEKLRAVEAELADNKQLRREAEAEYNKRIEQATEEYLAKKDKNTKVANNLISRIARLNDLKASVDANYAKRISDLEARVEKMNTEQYHRAMHKQDKMQEHAKWAENLLGDTSTWADKKLGLQYQTNTERRNLRDIVRDENGNKDIARADAIDDALNGRYNREEAAKKRELSQVRGKYADLKITKAEDAYIQMLGELNGNPDTTLTEKVVNEYYEKHKNKIDKDKVNKVLDLARQDYDSLLNRVNEKLREQGMKEIPYRQGYFPHFTEPKQNFIQKLLNWKTQDNEIPTSIAGLTEDFKPVKSWQSFDKTRHSDTTDYSFLKGFDNYSQGALDWIYHLDTLQKRRAVENHIRNTHSDEGIKARIKEVYANEEIDANEAQAQIEHILNEANNPLNNFVQDFTTHTNILAGKKNSLDRAVEQATNRHIYSVITNVQNRMSANMVLANVRSALTNFIPITQSWAQVSPLRSLQATKDTIANAIKDDGIINKSTFLTNRLREVDNLYKTNWDKVLDKAGIMFEIVDNFSSQVIWRSKYNQNLANGMTESQAIKNADQFAENVMAGRSKGNEPTLFNAKNPFVKAFTMFQLEVNNQYGYLFKDVPNDLKAETNHWKLNLAKGFTTAFIGAYVYNALLEQVAGSGAALDPIGIIEELLRDLGLFDDDEEKEAAEVVTNLIGNVGGELPFVGGTLFGGGRIPISSAMPYGGEYGGGLSGAIEDITEGNWGNIGKELMNPLLNIGLPVGGGQIKKTVQGLSMFNTDEDHPVAGSYTDSGSLRFPVEDTLGNRIQAGIFGQYASKNAREYFDNDYAPLKEKQIQEYVDTDLPIADYWKYREGLKGLKTLNEKGDYIGGLDLPVSVKNILINNIADRSKPIDFTGYENYSNFEEFDFATRYPEKYAVLKQQGISVSDYKKNYEETAFMYTDDFSWAANNPEKYTVSKAVTDDVIQYKQYTTDLYNIKADKDSSGKSINGSRKEKVIDYVNNLDIDYGAKLILFKSEYPSDDTYNEAIVEYLNNRDDLTYKERVTIYKELGFTVKGDYVYWD